MYLVEEQQLKNVKEGTSFVAGDIAIGAYNDSLQSLMDHFTAYDGIQAGDPAKLAKALFNTLQSYTPPLRLLCGCYAANLADRF